MGKVKNQMMEAEEGSIESLYQALKPFAEAYRRIQHYGFGDITNDTRLYAEEGNCLTELFADGTEESILLAVGHLANAAQICDLYEGSE